MVHWRSNLLLSQAMVGVFLLVFRVACVAQAQEERFSGPKGHFKVERPADLRDAEALKIYERMLDDIVEGYSLSRNPAAMQYRRWQRFNRAPYRSATHGERYVNNYANKIGEAYGRYEKTGTMPVGAVLAKDSFAVTSGGDVFVGPLFLMEKMPAGFNPSSRDWRYMMIMPDGSLFGETKGVGSQRVEFCITCHEAAGAENDHLFFIPDAYRTNISDTNKN